MEFLQSFSPDARSPKMSYDTNGKIIVIGAGGVGFWLVVAMSRIPEFDKYKIYVYDDDDFRGGNGSKRLPRVVNSRTSKIEHLSHFLGIFEEPKKINKQFTFLRYRFSPNYLRGDKIRLVIDCTDASMTFRKQLYGECEKAGVPFVRCSYDGEVVTFSRNLPLTISEDGGYNLIPNMAVTLAAGGIAAEKVRRILIGETVPDEDYHFGKVWYPEHPEEDLIESIKDRARPENAPVYDRDGNQIGVASDFYDFEETEKEEGYEEFFERGCTCHLGHPPCNYCTTYNPDEESEENEIPHQSNLTENDQETLVNAVDYSFGNEPNNTSLSGLLRTEAEQAINEEGYFILPDDELIVHQEDDETYREAERLVAEQESFGDLFSRLREVMADMSIGRPNRFEDVFIRLMQNERPPLNFPSISYQESANAQIENRPEPILSPVTFTSILVPIEGESDVDN